MEPSPVRAFIAVELPVEIQGQLDGVIKQLRKIQPSGVRWVASGNIHLTLKFLGDTLPADLAKLSDYLTPIASNHNPMDITVEGLGAFPNAKHPRVVWVGVKVPPEFQDLYKAIEAAAERIGCQREERGFSPHLTLGRVQKNASRGEVEGVSAALSSVRVGELGRFRAGSFIIFRSDLRPTGSIYTPLSHFELSGKSIG